MPHDGPYTVADAFADYRADYSAAVAKRLIASIGPQRLGLCRNSAPCRSTTNRVLTILKATLNHAHREGRCAGDDAWRTVRGFREADAARLRYLSDDESRRLTNASPSDFRALVTAALLSGCRYGELTAMIVDDFNSDAGTLRVRTSKSGKPRHVVLTQEGRDFVARLASGKPAAPACSCAATESLGANRTSSGRSWWPVRRRRLIRR